MQRRWSAADLEAAVQNSFSYRQVLKMLGLIAAGGNYFVVRRHIRLLGIDTSHFALQPPNKDSHARSFEIPLEKILKEDSNYQSYKLKKRLFREGLKVPRCEECGWAQYSTDGRLPLELDHINGKRDDNRLENLRILCPNCHSLKPTHRGRNRRKCARVAEWDTRGS